MLEKQERTHKWCSPMDALQQELIDNSCMQTQYSLENLQVTMDYRDRWKERERGRERGRGREREWQKNPG